MNKFDKWKELRIWLSGYGDYGHPPITAEEAFNTALAKMNELDAEEKRLLIQAVIFKPGDKVRHKNDENIGTGVVKDIAKSGIRAYVDFGAIDDWNKKRLNWKPYPAYYRIDLLEKAE